MQKPKLTDRIKSTLHYFRNGTVPQVHKQRRTSAAVIFNGTPQWQFENYGSYIREGFNLNAIIYSAIMYKYRAIQAAPLRAYTGSYDAPELLPEADPLAVVCASPNTHMSWQEFQGLNEVFLNISGNAFIRVDRQGDAVTMSPMRPDFVRIMTNREQNELLGYLYVQEGKTQRDGIPLLPEDVIHVKLPNPLDPLEGLGWGLSPLSSMAQSANVDNDVTKYLKLFFQNGAMPPGVLRFDAPLDDNDVVRARERWQEIYGGVDNWADVAVLDNGGSYERLSLSFDEMGFDGIDERNEARMLGPFGVPPILIGTRLGLNRSTYSNYEQAREAFWQDTMTPELMLFQSEYRRYLNSGDRFVSFDLSKVPALTDKDAYIAQVGEGFTRGAVTVNEYRAALDLPAMETGDTYLRSLAMMAIPADGTQSDASAADAVTVENDDREEAARTTHMQHKQLTHDQKALLWKQVNTTAQRYEQRFGEAAERAFSNDLRAILAIVRKAKTKALQQKATVAWSDALFEVQDYLGDEAADNWRDQFMPVMEALIVQNGEQLNAAFGVEFDVRNLLAEQWFDDYVIQFSQPINANTNETMRKMFQQAMGEGWSIDSMSDKLETMFRQWMKGDLTSDEFTWYEDRMPPYRRELIARTETIGASNKGSYELYRGWGAPYKEWLTQIDGRQRDTHAAANNQVRPIDEPFEVGGALMMQPGDKSAPVGEIANCRCTVLPRFEP